MVWISDLLAQGRTYSFEFFPPKNDQEQATLVRTLRELEPLAPSFVSVTYRGGRESRQRTHDLVAGMLRTTTLLPMAHLVCVAHTRLELCEILVSFRKAGIENLMALGGDPPTDSSTSESSRRPSKLAPAPTTAAPGLTMDAVTSPGDPAAATTTSPRRTWSARSGTPVCTTVTAALRPGRFKVRSRDRGLPMVTPRPITTTWRPSRGTS